MSIKNELDHDYCVGDTSCTPLALLEHNQIKEGPSSTTAILQPTQIKRETIDLCGDDFARTTTTTTRTEDTVVENKLPTSSSIWIEIPEEDDSILEIITMQNMIQLLNISAPPRNSNKVEKKTAAKKKNSNMQQAMKLYKVNSTSGKFDDHAMGHHPSATTASELRLSIIDLSHPFGRIFRENEGMVENIIKTTFFQKILHDHKYSYICPRYDDVYWYCGRLQITCADEASRQYLTEFVSCIGPLWPGCRLVAMNYLDFHKLKRIELYTNKFIPTLNEFLSLIERQNPELNAINWLALQSCRHNIFGAQHSFFVDENSFIQLQRMNGLVYYGVSRLLFCLYPERNLNVSGSYVERIMHFNWESRN